MDIAAITRIIDNTTPFRLKSAVTGRYVGKNTPVGAPYDTLVANTTDPNLAYKFIFKKDTITNSKFLASALDPTQTLTFVNESGTMIPNDRWNNIAWWSYFYPNPDGSVQIKGIVQGYGTFTLADRGPGWALGFGDPANPTAYPNRAYAWFIETISSTPAPQPVAPVPQPVAPVPQPVAPAPYSSPTTGAPLAQTPTVAAPSPVYNQQRDYQISPPTTTPSPQPTAVPPSPEGFKFLGIDSMIWLIILGMILLAGGGYWFMT